MVPSSTNASAPQRFLPANDMEALEKEAAPSKHQIQIKTPQQVEQETRAKAMASSSSTTVANPDEISLDDDEDQQTGGKEEEDEGEEEDNVPVQQKSLPASLFAKNVPAKSGGDDNNNNQQEGGKVGALERMKRKRVEKE